MKIKESLLNNLALPLILAILIPMASALGSLLATGEWITWINFIPWFVWIIFLIIIVIWTIGILVNKRLKRIRNNRPSIAAVPRVYERYEIGEVSHAGVIWKVYVNYTDPFDSFETTSIKNFDTDSIPRCPECKTELEEQKSFWRGYVWSCPRCGFKKKNKDSRLIESERAAKIARRDIEKKRKKE